jgi:hypothetical protein
MVLTLNNVEQARFEIWYAKHRRRKGCDKGADHVIVDFHETGIGTSVVVICPYCKCKKDITDYESW